MLQVMRDHDISQRRACQLVGVDPKTVRRDRPPDSAEIRKEMQEIAGKRRRFGYRRIGVLLERKGMIMNHKKLYRIYREEGLSVKRRRGRKRARGTRTPLPVAAYPNARWSLDFVSDSFGASRKFRILAVIDDCTRECLCLVADTSLSGARVARELSALIRAYQLHMADTNVTPSIFNARTVTLRFLFSMTCDRDEMKKYMQFRTEPRNLPIVLGVEKVSALLASAPGPGLKYRAALSIGYGGGLRASEVTHLKVREIDKRAAQMGICPGSSSSRPHDRAGRWLVERRQPPGRVQAWVLSACAGFIPTVSALVYRRVAGSAL